MIDDLNRRAALAGHFKKARDLAIDVANLEGRIGTDDPRELDVDASLFHYDLVELREQLDGLAEAGELEGLQRVRDYVEQTLEVLGEAGVRIDEEVAIAREAGRPELAPVTETPELTTGAPMIDGPSIMIG